MSARGASAELVTEWLNQRAGLLGVAGVSRDVRDLIGRAATDARAHLAWTASATPRAQVPRAYLAGALEQRPVLREQRPARPSGQAVLVVGDRDLPAIVRVSSPMVHLG